VRPKPFRIVFPEGFTRKEMAARVTAVAQIARRERGKRVRLKEQAYLAATANPRLQQTFGTKALPLEGFLFPATYDFAARTTSPQLVASQLKAFRENWRKVNLAYARSKNLTPYDVLIIASMIEKEAVAPAERKLVAAVIYNRLRNRMPLGIDATIRYGRDVPGTEPLKQSDLESDDPYNTRKRLGLPPTPISNPGLASMRAAVRVNSAWLRANSRSPIASNRSAGRSINSSARYRASTAAVPMANSPTRLLFSSELV